MERCQIYGKEDFNALGREAFRKGGNIIKDIAENLLTQTTDIITKQVAASTQNIIAMLRGSGRGRKRKRVSSDAA
jgi:hypothetical protein